jgi:DNA-directed RNA polymerase subunit F
LVEKKKTFLEYARLFRLLAKAYWKRHEDELWKIDSYQVVCLSLAEICEQLAEIQKKKGSGVV